MNTSISHVMREKLQSVPPGSALLRTFEQDTSSRKEELLDAGIASDDKLLVLNYAVFPGIQVTYNYFLAYALSHQHPHMPAIMEINHCRQGRMGWQMEHNLNLYLGQGDLSFHRKDCCSKSSLSLPLGYYEGLSFSIDLQKLRQNPPGVLQDTEIDYDKIRAMFCHEARITAIPQNSDIDGIFNGLYNLPETLVVPYCKLKAQELILFLSRLPSREISGLQPYDTEQVRIVKEIQTFLTADLGKRYTIEYLSKKYLLNTSTLKSTFKAVYGMPIAAYMKEYRMNQAMSYLRETDYSMAEIAGLVGYENQSKFTAAFKNAVGVLPTAYRKSVLSP